MISKITTQQEAKIPYYIQKWIEIASQPINREKAKEVIKKIYKEEKIVIFGESFDNTIDLIRVATKGKKLEYDSQLDSQLHSQLHSQLYSQLDSQLDSQLGSQLYSQLYSQLHSQLRSRLDSLKIKYSSYISYYLYDWAGYYDYGKYIGVEFDEQNLQDCFDILLNIPIVIFVGNILFVCEKPKCLWENQTLHSEIKPAISWQDGTGIYFLKGVKLEKDLWENIVNKTISAKEAIQLTNQEHRTLALQYLGFEKLQKECNAKTISTDQYGEIIELNILDTLKRKFRYYKAIDPSKNEYVYLRTNPEVKTPKEAMTRAYKLERLNIDYEPILRT